MGRFHRLAIAFASTSLLGVAQPVQFDGELLALLDPSARMASLCGGGKGSSMRDKIAMVAAIIQAQQEPGIRLYDGLGKIHFPITTANPMAQRYFDQGLGFAYGFNHAAAIASFREAQKLDPGCAMCWWGEALAHGPNINAPITPDANALALKANAKALELSANVTPAERALIMALAKRYSADATAKRADLDGAYADAMLLVARYYPQHDDIALLAAEAAMDTLPWNYWDAAKQNPQPRLGEDDDRRHGKANGDVDPELIRHRLDQGSGVDDDGGEDSSDELKAVHSPILRRHREMEQRTDVTGRANDPSCPPRRGRGYGSGTSTFPDVHQTSQPGALRTSPEY